MGSALSHTSFGSAEERVIEPSGHAPSDQSLQFFGVILVTFLHALVLEIYPPSHPRRSVVLSGLADFATQPREPGAGTNLDLAVLLFGLPVELCSPDYFDRARLLHNLATVLATRFELSGHRADLDRAVLLHEQTLELHPSGYPGHANSFDRLADALLTRFQQSRDHADLDKAVILREHALDLRPPGDPDRAASLKNLGTLLHMRFENSGHHADLDRAVTLHGQALELRPPGDSYNSVSPLNIVGALAARFRQSGNRADLDRAVILTEQALALYPSGHSERLRLLSLLAVVISTQFEQSGNLADLDRAVLLHEQTFELHPPGHPDRSSSLEGLANTLLIRFKQLGNRADLDRGMLLLEQALQLCPPGHSNHSRLLNNHAHAVVMRFEQLGDPGDLDRAVLLTERALEFYSPGHPLYSTSLNNLAVAVSSRFKYTGIRADLDRAVLLHEQALEVCPPGHVERLGYLNNLANVIAMRFEQSGNRVDLDRAVLLHEQALELSPSGHPGRVFSLNTLAHAVSKRFEQSGDRADLDRAVLLCEEAVEHCPTGHPHHSTSLNNLANAVFTRFKQSRSCADLETVAGLHEQALKLRTPSHPDFSASLCNLIDIVSTQFEQSGNLTHLTKALFWCHLGLKIIPDTDVYRSKMLTALGDLYTARSHPSDQPLYLGLALDAFSQGAHAQSSPLSYRFEAAAQWLTIAIRYNQQQSGTTACEAAITLLPQLLWLELDLRSRLAALKRAAGLVCDGAACAIKNSEFAHAVELLEGGRGVFWTHTLQLRMPHTSLPSSFSQKLTNLSQALRSVTLEDSSSKQSLSAGKLAAENVRRRELVDQWSQTLKDIRGTTGFERFLLPQPFKELAEASKHGPVIILNASRHLGCDAVVIKSPHLPPKHVALPGMTYEELLRFRAGLTWQTGRDAARHLDPPAWDIFPSFRKILEKLWISVAKPIIDILGIKKSDDPQRLWWCPTSLFTFLPIHAAGIYDAKGSADISEYVVSSYIPTLDALNTARSHAAPIQAHKVLVIIQPETPGLKPLPYTVEERKRIRDVVPPADFLHLSKSHSNKSVQDGSDATVENVLSRLSEASIVHFACHGTQSKDPLKSALHLQDGQLTVDSIIHRDLPNASIAFLSACHSAAGTQEQPDEAVHMGAAMLAAGYQSVIATMWSMGDKEGPLVAEEVYARLFSFPPDPTYTAPALHAAIRKLRDTGADFAAWVPFIHLGV